MFWERIGRMLDLGPGGALRSAIATLRGRWRRERRAHQSAAFTNALVALAAKMAKADGVAVHLEKEAFERFLETPPGEIENVRRLYDLARQDTAGYETYAGRIGNLLKDEPDLKEMVLECLICIACADGVLHPAEDAFLGTVAEKFGLTQAEYRRARALFVRDAASPYDILDVAADAPDSVIKARYRKLVSELHPDRLTAAGARPAIIKAATAKLAAINAAYDAILSDRAKRRPA